MAVVVAGVIALGWWLFNGTSFDVLAPAGSIAEQQRTLLYATLGLSALVVVPVFVMLAVFAVRYRESASESRYDPSWNSNVVLETIWWGIPIVIIGILAGVTWQTSHSLDPHKPIASSTPPLTVQVIALQWKWLFVYPDQKVASVNLLPVPLHTPLQFRITADAPMSSFWVPSLGSQIYAMKGMVTELNLMATKQGEYRGYNTNINGEGYARMNFTVKAMSKGEFSSWLQTASSQETLTQDDFETLVEPGTLQKPALYSLRDFSPLEATVMKYMHSGSMYHGQAAKTSHKGHAL